MESLLTIVNNLSAGELKLVRHFYKLKNFGECRKRVQLLELVINQKISDNKQAAEMLGYTASNTSSFKHLKARLKSDLLCMLLMQECSTKFTTPYAQAMFDCRRFLMQGEILMSRGVYDEALDLLGKASKIANKFELFAEGLQIEDLRRNHIASRGNMKDFEEACSSIEENYARLGKVMTAKRYHYEITTPSLHRVNSYAEYIRNGEADTNTSTGSSRVKLYNNLSSINYLSSIRDFETAQHHAVDLLYAVENDLVVKSKSNQAGVNMELANIYLNTGNFEKAISHASRAVELFKPGMINQLYAQLALFFAYFRNNDLKNADKILKTASAHRLIKTQEDPLMISRLQLFRAAIAFKAGNYDECAFILRENADHVRDKDAWMPGYFILEMLMLLEKKSFELAFYRTEAFRKMLERNSAFKDEKRIMAITKVLKLIVRVDGEFNKISPDQKDLLLLSEGSGHFYWNPAGYEVIRFDEWLLKKIADQHHKKIA
jgi:tetratricopeptide (TPR) repeat protein